MMDTFGNLIFWILKETSVQKGINIFNKDKINNINESIAYFIKNQTELKIINIYLIFVVEKLGILNSNLAAKWVYC